MESLIPSRFRQGSVLLVPRAWATQLACDGALSSPETFPAHPEVTAPEAVAFLRQCKSPGPEWVLLRLDTYRRKPGVRVRRLPDPVLKEDEDDDPSFADVLHGLASSSLEGMWSKAKEKWGGGGRYTDKVPETESEDHDKVLLEILRRLYGSESRVVEISNDLGVADKCDFDDSSRHHLAGALAIVVERESISVVRPLLKFSVGDALRFSPAFFGEAPRGKTLFVLYQILKAAKSLHRLGLSLGEASLHDIAVDDENYVSLEVDPMESIVIVNDTKEKGSAEEVKNHFAKSKELADSLAKAMKNSLSKQDGKAEELFASFLGSACRMWTRGELSNFDYLLFLNYLCGRNFSNPNHYPVIPWVRDFSSEAGGWRDLSKSKFRLNKGDAQLDTTFNTLSEIAAAEDKEDSVAVLPEDPSKSHIQAPHHISDVLSEITYYVYMARRTDRSVLCRHVRRRWVPAEYPSSMRRLQAWTPDECVPEFFCDPGIFVSLHEDLPDLEVPEWCRSPEEFVSWHRAALESPRVSSRLHQWIDLTFGYKLTGSSAVKAKNVCLHLVDGHSELRLDGVVQLFNHPHPAKKELGPFWGSKAPSLESLKVSKVLHHQEEEEANKEETKGAKKSPKAGGGEEESQESKLISLPKDFDPLAKLNEVESLEGFVIKTSPFRSGDAAGKDEKSNEKSIVSLPASSKKKQRNVLGCLILELFLPKKFNCLGEHSDLSTRLKVCRAVLNNEPHTVPLCVRQAAVLLLQPEADEDATFLIDPRISQLLVPQVSPVVFPDSFPSFARTLRLLHQVEESLDFSNKRGDEAVTKKTGEFMVKVVGSELQGVLGNLRAEEELELILPAVKKLFSDPSTAITSAWLIFDQLARVLGRRATTRDLLHHILFCYDGEGQTSKHLKLYHRTFLQILIVRFGTGAFLRYFATYLIEAVGGYKDYEDDASRPVRQGLERSWRASESHSSRPGSSLSDASSENNTSGAAAAGAPRDEETEVSRRSVASSNKESVTEDPLAEGEVFAFDNVSLSGEAGGGGAAPTSSDSTSEVFVEVAKGEIYIPPVRYDMSDNEEEVLLRSGGVNNSGGNISQVQD